MPALQLAAIRQFIGGFITLLFLIKKTPWPKGKQWKTIFILSIVNFVLATASVGRKIHQ
jgi:preprotein translocase subunit SecE